MILAFFVSNFALFGIVLGSSAKRDKVLFFNTTAKNFYEVISKSQLPEEIISNDQIIFLFGESSENGDIILYGKTNEPSRILTGDAPFSNGYWAIKIQNEVVLECWFATHPLNQDELHFYSLDEQHSVAKIFEKIKNSEVVGYYHSGKEGLGLS